MLTVTSQGVGPYQGEPAYESGRCDGALKQIRTRLEFLQQNTDPQTVASTVRDCLMLIDSVIQKPGL